MTHLTETQYLDYADWHRIPCEITPWLIVTGDLHPNAEKAAAQLEQWRQLDVTDIIDTRGEACVEISSTSVAQKSVTTTWGLTMQGRDNRTAGSTKPWQSQKT